MAYDWLDKSEYPFKSHYFNVNGQAMHYIEEGSGDVILYVHGTPSWSFDFRNVIKRLIVKYRCIAIDHIGFGLSSKPEDYNYSTQNHSKTLEKFVLDKDLNNVTLVVHDFGGPIGLNFAIQYPEKIKRLVIINSWLWSCENDPDFIKLKWALKSPLLPILYRYFNFSPRYILPNSFGEIKLTKHLLKHYTRPFANASQRSGGLAFTQSLLDDQGWFEELWDKRQSIAQKPALFIWGMQDKIVKPHNLDKFQSVFVDATTLKLQESGHFPQEEQPRAAANAILSFMHTSDRVM